MKRMILEYTAGRWHSAKRFLLIVLSIAFLCIIALSASAMAGETPSSIFTPPPGSMADVEAYIDAFNEAMYAGDYDAAAAAKPRWEHPVPAELMPPGYHSERVTDDADFGADYYTFFVGIVPLAAACI
ncbi:MAG: hypothetical protein FWF33_02895 [Clostridiales bacterium]|nr:hypothetical protein [Clostridiales bacterium]